MPEVGSESGSSAAALPFDTELPLTTEDRIQDVLRLIAKSAVPLYKMLFGCAKDDEGEYQGFSLEKLIQVGDVSSDIDKARFFAELADIVSGEVPAGFTSVEKTEIYKLANLLGSKEWAIDEFSKPRKKAFLYLREIRDLLGRIEKLQKSQREINSVFSWAVSTLRQFLEGLLHRM